MTTPETPQQIRDLLRTDPNQVEDRDLLALIVARGAAFRRPGQRKSRGTIGLASDIYTLVGGQLDDFVERMQSGQIDLTLFGIGESIGARLIASADLAQRWRHDFQDGEDGSIQTDDMAVLRKTVFLRKGTPTEAELIAVLLGQSFPDDKSTVKLLEEFGSPRNVMASLSPDGLVSFRENNRPYIRLPQTRAGIEFNSLCRLVAAVELARRYRFRTGPTSATLVPGMFGLQSVQLVQLLDPASSFDQDFRAGMIDMLRSHPELAQDFTKLDQLASDAQTTSYHRAIELALMFEELCQGKSWSHPAEVLGESVPYGALLAIAEARIARASQPPERLLKIKGLLEQAEQEAAAPPIASFVEALVGLRLSRSAAEGAIDEVRRRYFGSSDAGA